MKDAFETIGQIPNITALLIERYSEQMKYKEKGSINIRVEQLTRDAIEPVSLHHHNHQLESPSTISSPGYLIDISSQAQQDGFAVSENPSRQLIELFGAIESHALTVLVTDNQNDAERIINELAVSLLDDKVNLFNVSGVFRIDDVRLASNPNLVIVNALKQAKGGILYLPQLDQYLGQIESALPALIRSSLAARDIRIITSFSSKQWQKLSETRDFISAYSIVLDPASLTESIVALRANRSKLETQFKTKTTTIKITDDAIDAAAKLSARYMPGGEIPLIRQAATLTKISMSTMKNLADPRVKPDGIVDEKDVVLALFYLKGIVVQPENPEKYIHMEDTLRKLVVGQDEAIEAVSKGVRRAMVGLKNPRKPIGSFIFLGPTGVGKTELGRALASFLFDDPEAMLRLNMSEYHDKHTVARLVGAPPGYVGYEEGGQLTEYLRRRPYAVVMADEMEKAHSEVLNTWLQILDDGRITDGKGKVTNCRNTVHIFTSNVGTAYYRQESQIGRKKVIELVKRELTDTFRPEFLNRFDEIIVFQSLSMDNVKKIVDLRMHDFNLRLAEESKIVVQLTNEAKILVSELGYKPEFGAREVERVINRNIGDALTVALLRGEYKPGDTIEVSAENRQFVFAKKQ